MDKQSTIGIVLIGIILAVWLMMQPKPQPAEPVQKDTVVQTVPQEKPAAQTVKTDTPKTETVKNENTEVSPYAASVEPEKIITVETDLVRLEMTNRGAKLRRYFLKKYNTWYNVDLPEDAPWYKKWVQLVNTSKNGGDFDMVFVTRDGQYVNTSKIDFTRNDSAHYYKLEGTDSLSIAYTLNIDDDKSIVKTYTFFGDKYDSQVDIELNGLHNEISSATYDFIWENGLNFVEKNSFDEAQTAQAVVYMGDENVTLDAEVGEQLKETLNGNVGWIGQRNKYFGIIVSPLQSYDDNSGAYIEGTHTKNERTGDEREYYNITLRTPFKKQNYQKDSFQVYFGPMDYDILYAYGKGYESMYDFGNFMGMSFITRPISEYFLLPLFKFLHQFIPNYGFVIIIFSLIIKLLLFPLTKQSYKSMNRMKLLQPKIQELKEKYKDDQARVQKETMNLYSKYGVNPMGGCLPMLLQMPILFALFSFFRTTIDLRHQPFVLWIDNLSSPDVLFDLPFALPFLGNEISGLALILGITMFLQQKMSVSDPAQKAMVYMMPVMFMFMFNSFASGLNLYYAMFNLFSIIQQKLVNNKVTELQPVTGKKKKGGGFMQRMMEAAEQKQKEQQQMMKKKKR